MRNKVLYLILILLSYTVVCNATQSTIEYDISYNILTDSTGVRVNATYDVHNGMTEEKQLYLIVAAFRNGTLSRMNISQVTIDSNCSSQVGQTIILNPNIQNYEVKLYVWDCANLRPIGEFEAVDDLNNYIRTKSIYCTYNAGDEFNVYINSVNAKSTATDIWHSVIYNTDRVQPVDLCALTYDKELSTGEIANAGITITGIDSELGIVDFTSDFDEGNTTGLCNVIKFKALVDLNNEEITYMQ